MKLSPNIKFFHFINCLVLLGMALVLYYDSPSFSKGFGIEKAKTVASPAEQRDLDAAGLRHHPVIFVGGFPRSGTTLMRSMLDAHPQVRCGLEPAVIPAILSLRRRSHIYLNNTGVDDNVLNDAVSAFISEIIVKHDEPAERYCNKNPVIMKSAVYLAQLYRKAKFIFMIRDGRASVNSYFSRGVAFSTMQRLNTINNYERSLSGWDKAVAEMWKQCQAVSRCLPVWYEMLVQNPRKIGAKVLEFLDLPWNESILHHDEAVDKPGGIKLSNAIWSSSLVKKPINLSALKKFVGNVPHNVEVNLRNIAPMIEFLGYDTSPDPDYSYIHLPAEYRTFYEVDS